MLVVVCNHVRSIVYYIDAIFNQKSFIAEECPSIEDYDRGLCKKKKTIFMGPLTDTK